MKVPLTFFLISLLPLVAQNGVEAEEATIPGEVADGSPVAPVAKPETPRFSIEDSTITRLPDHSVVFHQVVPPDLPAPPPPLAAQDVAEPEAKARLAEMRRSYQGTSLTFVSATVYDHKVSFIRWWPNGGQGKEICGWSNIDWNHMGGFSSYKAGDASGELQNYALLLGIGNIDTTSLRKLLEKQGKDYQPPVFPDLPDLATEGPAFIVTQGDVSDVEAMAVMNGLHALYGKESDRLRLAWIGREQAAKEQAEFQRLNPPVPQDTVIHFWPKNSRRHSPSATQLPVSR